MGSSGRSDSVPSSPGLAGATAVDIPLSELRQLVSTIVRFSENLRNSTEDMSETLQRINFTLNSSMIGSSGNVVFRSCNCPGNTSTSASPETPGIGINSELNHRIPFQNQNSSAEDHSRFYISPVTRTPLNPNNTNMTGSGNTSQRGPPPSSRAGVAGSSRTPGNLSVIPEEGSSWAESNSLPQATSSLDANPPSLQPTTGRVFRPGADISQNEQTRLRTATGADMTFSGGSALPLDPLPPLTTARGNTFPPPRAASTFTPGQGPISAPRGQVGNFDFSGNSAFVPVIPSNPANRMANNSGNTTAAQSYRQQREGSSRQGPRGIQTGEQGENSSCDIGGNGCNNCPQVQREREFPNPLYTSTIICPLCKACLAVSLSEF